MQLVIELTADEEGRVREAARIAGKPVDEFVRGRLGLGQPTAAPSGAPSWGAAVLQRLEAEADLPIWQDLPEDAPELAAKFARMAEAPGPHPCG